MVQGLFESNPPTRFLVHPPASVSEHTSDPALRRLQARAAALGWPPTAHLLVVNTDHQRLTHWLRTDRLAAYPVSTSRYGLGCRENSLQTPTGFHAIRDRIGADAPLGQVFKHREPTPDVMPPDRWRDADNTDRILTRILRLDGREPGHNQGPPVDSYQRYIYLHGTNQEHRLGHPASHGCIRLGNRDIADLFKTLGDDPTWCWIGQLNALIR